MSVREALERLIATATTPEEIEVEYIAFKVEAAFESVAEEMAELAEYRADQADIDQCVTAGMKKLGEAT